MDQDQILTVAQGRNPEQLLDQLMMQGLLIFFAAIIVYIPAMSGGFIYDDDLLLTQNPLITRGAGFNAESWKGLDAIWFPVGEKMANDYAPLASTTLWLEWRLWGNNEPGTPTELHGVGAAGYHITNILLHAVSALLLWAVLLRIGMPWAWLAALAWAVHPVGVESVAWIAERRNTLSMFVLMPALLAWLRFQRAGAHRHYWLALVLFALALLAKSTVVMLPFFLLLWIWWNRGKVAPRDLIGTAPFFLLSLVLGLMTVYFQNSAIAGETAAAPLLERLISAVFALGFYFYKAVLPFNLMFNYPEWHKTIPAVLQLIPGVLFAAAFIWSWCNRASWGRHVILGLGFFAIMIAPALGIHKMAYMRITLLADHFEYMPMAGVIALGVAGAAMAWKRCGTPAAKYVFCAAVAGVVVLFSLLTWQRANVFHLPESLWTDTLDKNPDAWQAHEHMAGVLTARGDLRGALAHFKRGVELRPGFGETHQNYGNTLRGVGRLNEALEENRLGAELSAENINSVCSYADTLYLAGRYPDAIRAYHEALKLTPDYPIVLNNIGEMYLRLGNTHHAVGFFRMALRYAPYFSIARQNLNMALQRQETERNQ